MVSMRPTRALLAREMQPGGLPVNDYAPHRGRWGRLVVTRASDRAAGSCWRRFAPT